MSMRGCNVTGFNHIQAFLCIPDFLWNYSPLNASPFTSLPLIEIFQVDLFHVQRHLSSCHIWLLHATHSAQNIKAFVGVSAAAVPFVAATKQPSSIVQVWNVYFNVESRARRLQAKVSDSTLYTRKGSTEWSRWDNCCTKGPLIQVITRLKSYLSVFARAVWKNVYTIIIRTSGGTFRTLGSSLKRGRQGK